MAASPGILAVAGDCVNMSASVKPVPGFMTPPAGSITAYAPGDMLSTEYSDGPRMLPQHAAAASGNGGPCGSAPSTAAVLQLPAASASLSAGATPGINGV